MTIWEVIRMFCYVLMAPSLLYLALYNARTHNHWCALLYGSMALLFTWYVIEISLASTGVNTREYRIIGTPMILAMTAAVLGLVLRVRSERRRHDPHWRPGAPAQEE